VQHQKQDYANSHDLLYYAYYNEGLAQRAGGNLSSAYDMFKTALALRPNLSAPRLQMTEIESAPFFHIPFDDKFVVVGLTEQRMWLYEQGYRRYDFMVKTGPSGEETMSGDFEILNKIELTYGYGDLANLELPYWLGIYWVGAVQNGIHGPPFDTNTDRKLWEDSASHGCIVLNDQDIIILYNWAGVGVKLKVVPSLANWSVKE